MRNKTTDKLIFSLWLMSSEMVMYVEKKIKPLGLTVHDLRAVIVLGEQGAMSPSDLASALGVTNGAVTGIVNRLLAAKVVERNKDSPDKRRSSVVLRYSELDTALLDAVDALRSLFNDYTPQQIQTIIQNNEDILKTLKKAKNNDTRQ